MKHTCDGLAVHISEIDDYDIPFNVNGATADAIKKEKDNWFLIVNSYEYGIKISYCPYCGFDLRTLLAVDKKIVDS